MLRPEGPAVPALPADPTPKSEYLHSWRCGCTKMTCFESQRGPFRISTNKSLLNVPLIYHWLSTVSYWAPSRSLETVQRSIDNSLCFGVYEAQRQVGFARVVTDYATFAWLCDVFIIEEYRGQGLGKWLIETITAHPLLQSGLFVLATRDAHGLYQRYGSFEPLPTPERWMSRRTCG
jgi:GNAT superfamily N-acetyltransferase